MLGKILGEFMLRYCSLLLMSSLALTACQNNQTQVIPAPPPLTEQQSMAQLIENQGAQIIQQGARLQIILPTDIFFRMGTTQLKYNQINTLKLISKYLKNYSDQFEHSPLITVSGHTDTVYNKENQAKLSQQYAEVVASFLWNQGFSQKQLQVHGLSSTDPIGNPKTARGSSDNRRVVIQAN